MPENQPSCVEQAAAGDQVYQANRVQQMTADQKWCQSTKSTEQPARLTSPTAQTMTDYVLHTANQLQIYTDACCVSTVTIKVQGENTSHILQAGDPQNPSN